MDKEYPSPTNETEVNIDAYWRCDQKIQETGRNNAGRDGQAAGRNYTGCEQVGKQQHAAGYCIACSDCETPWDHDRHLLSFRDALSPEEITAYVKKLDEDLETREYAEVFAEVKKTLEEYPNCDQLLWQAAVILEARRNINQVPDKEKYDDIIYGWLERCLRSEDGNIRKEAAGSLFYAYLQKEEYEKAQSYLSYLAVDSPERKRKEALIFSKTGKKEEAYRAYEELLFTNYQFISLVLNDLRTLYMKDEEHDMAWKLVDVQNQAARVFEMGKYYEVSTGLDVASWEKDVPKTAEIMREILETLNHIGDFSQSRLY